MVRRIARDDAYFHTLEWQAMEREADEAIARGEVSPPVDVEVAIAQLRSLSPPEDTSE
ncbi:MAG: hypothetical protein Q7S96_03375 [bacterium]|nr:hypothetical protein [bacterium]